MKKQLLALLLFLVGLSNLSAQSAASVQWDCIADENVTTTVGNIEGQPLVGSNFVVRDYKGTSSTGPLSGSHQRWWPGKDAAGTGIFWGPEKAPVENRYIQIEVAPKTGHNFTISKVEMYMAAGGTDNMRAGVLFATHPSFIPSTVIADTIKLKQGKTKPEDTVIVYNGNVEVKSGEKFLVRIFPWYDGTSSNSKYVYLQKVSVTGTTTGGTAVEETGIPVEFNLNQNFPNPFNPATKISFSLPKEGFTKLVVYDLLGKEVSILVKDKLNAGAHSINFDAKNLPSGVYLYALTSGNYSSTKKMILIK
ncbi:MAG: T9SS type A sorting domain-containing protein [Melioribacteraceae bacterium]